MDFWLNFRLKVRDFFVKYRLIFIIILIGISIIFTINFAIKKGEINKSNNGGTSINNNPTGDPSEEIPEQYSDAIEKLISDYFNYCNNKEYESAYVLLSDDFKNLYFKNINRFKTYIDNIFTNNRIYSIETKSNFNNIYVYKINIINNPLATGTIDDSETLSDKFIIKRENGVFKIALNGYCGQENLNIMSEDDYMEINILSRRIYYDKETYVIQYKNKTNNYIVLANGKEDNEIGISVQGITKFADTLESNVVILPNETTTKVIDIEKFADNGKQTNQFILNAIRVLPKYSGNSDNLAKEMNDAIKKYSLTIDLIQREQETTEE